MIPLSWHVAMVTYFGLPSIPAGPAGVSVWAWMLQTPWKKEMEWSVMPCNRFLKLAYQGILDVPPAIEAIHLGGNDIA